jgi:excisionase family DNA binding protein
LALSPTHAAQALGVRPALVYAAVKSGKLPVYRPSGTKRKILVCDLIEWYRTEWERVS